MKYGNFCDYCNKDVKDEKAMIYIHNRFFCCNACVLSYEEENEITDSEEN